MTQAKWMFFNMSFIVLAAFAMLSGACSAEMIDRTGPAMVTGDQGIRLKATTGDDAFAEAKATPGYNRNVSVIYQYAGAYYLRLNDLVGDPPPGYRVLDTDCLPSTWTAALC